MITRMSRILFTSTAGLGHVLPMLRPAAALRDRGHEVRWVTGPGGGAAAAEAEGYAVTIAGYAETARFEEYVRRYPEAATLVGPARAEHAFSRMFAEVGAAAMAPGLVAAADEWRPDVVVHDAAELAAPIAAARLGVPCVRHGFGLPVPPHRLAAADEYLSDIWRAYGVGPRSHETYDHLYVDIAPPALHDGSALPAVPIQRMRPADAAPREATERPLVYVTFGTVFNKQPERFHDVVAGAAATGADVLVTVGPGGDAAALGPLPPSVTVEQFVPQARVLPRCAAVASHAGSGTTFAALAHGVPNLLIPVGADQFGNAAGAAAYGAAISFLDGPPSRAEVTDAIGRLLGEPSFAEAAARLADQIAAMPGPDAVAAAVESLVG